MTKDLYEVLGVAKGANEAEIKKAYRQRARQFHPDVNKAPGSEAKFKEVQKAYDILSDSSKKAQYDQFGIADDSPQGAGGYGGFGGARGFGGFSGSGNGSGFEGIEDIFDSFFGGNQRRASQGRRSSGRRGEDLRYDLEISLEEAAKGCTKKIDIQHMEKCDKCKGTGSEAGSAKSTCTTCNGQGEVRTVQRTILGSFSQISTCPQCQGTGQIIKTPCSKCRGRKLERTKRTIEVNIPAGVDTDTRLRVTNEGNAGDDGGRAGDLYVFISVKRHPYFTRKENDIYYELEIPFTQAALGTDVEVPTLFGNVILKIPAGTQSHTTFRFKGKGIPFLNSYNKGDQQVMIKVNIPKNLFGKQKQLIEELAELRKERKR